MRRLTSSWSGTLRKLGFKRTSKPRRQTRRFQFGSMEPRWVFSTSHSVTSFLPGNCPDGQPCECATRLRQRMTMQQAQMTWAALT